MWADESEARKQMLCPDQVPHEDICVSTLKANTKRQKLYKKINILNVDQWDFWRRIISYYLICTS